MRTLPTKFDQYNKAGVNKPALIVKLQSNVNYVDQKYQSDWSAAYSSSQVDWTPSPPNAGEVILNLDVPFTISQTIEDAQVSVPYGSAWTGFMQSFTLDSGAVIIEFSIKVSELVDNPTTCFIEIWTAGKSVKVCSGEVAVLSTGIKTFSFDQWLSAGSYEVYLWHNNIQSVLYVSRSTSDTYAGGYIQAYGTSGDLYFSIGLKRYQPSGQLTTQVMSLSAVPTQYGEWVFDDVVPIGTSLAYQAWTVNTPSWTFPTSWESLGTVIDGQQITNLKQFYRTKAAFASNSGQDLTPTLKSIRADFSLYEGFSNRAGFGLPVSVQNVSNLSMEIDLFNGSTIGEIDINFSDTPQIRKWLALARPKNKMVKVMAGFIADGFTETDFIDYRWGQIDDYSLEDDVVTIKMKDFSKEWDADVPTKWASVGDDITWTGSHHADVIKDILLNRIAVRDSKLDTGALATVKDQTSGWTVTRKITGNSENAADLVEQLRMDLAAFFIHTPTGAIRIKRWDPTEAAGISIDDKVFISKSWEANANELYNRCATYFAWVGSGDDAKDFLQFKETVNSDSQYQYQQVGTFELKDNWTTAAGSFQVADLHSKIITRYGDPAPAIFHAEVDRKYIAIEVGDMVNITTDCAPSSDGLGIVDMKFQVIRTEFDFMNDRINLDFKRV